MLTIMEMYGWDYYTYMKQPIFVLANIYNYLDTKQEVEDKKHE